MLQVFKLSRANGFIMWPHSTYNAQQNIHCDANKNHNKKKTEKQVSSFVRVLQCPVDGFVLINDMNDTCYLKPLRKILSQRTELKMLG